MRAAKGWRNSKGFTVAAYLRRDMLFDRELARELLDIWSEQRCSPPLEPWRLDDLAENGARYGHHLAGIGNWEALYEAMGEAVGAQEVEGRGWAAGEDKRMAKAEELFKVHLRWAEAGQKAKAAGQAAPPLPGSPEPLPEPLLPVEKFDFDLLPEGLRPWAKELHESMQCPGDFIGVSVMVGLGTVIGRKVVIRPKEHDSDWVEAANNFGMLIGRPGILKSPAVSAALKPLNGLEAAAREAQREAVEAFKAKTRAAKAKAKGVERCADKMAAEDPFRPVEEIAAMLRQEAPKEEDEPALKRYITNDANPASLGKLLLQNPNGILVHRDELVSLFESFRREDMDGMRGLFLSGWSGTGSHTLDRISRGLDLHIPSLCISMLGTTQPGKLAPYIRQTAEEGQGDDGLIQRFQFAVWPDAPEEWADVDKPRDPQPRREAFKVFERLDQLSGADCGATDTDGGKPVGLPYLRFDPAAQARFREWRRGLEILIRSGELSPALESHIAKYRKLIPSVALILHLAEGGRGAVTLEALERAIRWGKYLLSHARRIYGSGPTALIAAAKTIITQAKAGKLPAEFTARDVLRSRATQLSKSESIKEALELLCDYNWLLSKEQKTAGRSKICYWLNSKV
jgi:putative DNA primase/helicase